MKKQIMTAFAVSTMMTLAMPFASFAAARSCQTSFRPVNIPLRRSRLSGKMETTCPDRRKPL